MVPAWHGFGGGHAAPASHTMQLPVLQTPPSQFVPSGSALPRSTQTPPASQSIAPPWQSFAAMQFDPVVHETQLPARQIPNEQRVPSLASALVPTQEIPKPHSRRPIRQSENGGMQPPSQTAQAPEMQNPASLHAVPSISVP